MRATTATLLSEFVGTATLVFVGCGAVVVDVHTGGALGHFGVSSVWGFVVAALVFSLGDVSGAHINPAVTIGFAAAKRFAWAEVVPYIAAQCAGAIAGAGLLRLVFAEAEGLGQTQPNGSVGQSFGLEVAITFVLMLVILRVSTGAAERGAQAGLAVGLTVLVLAAVAGPISGASINPARSLGPALVAGDLGDLWLYALAPTLGAVLSVPVARLMVRTPAAR